VTTHRVGEVLAEAARGRFPEPDGTVEVVSPWLPGVEAVVSLTGRAYIATGRPTAAVLARRPDGFGGAVDPRFVTWLAGPAGWYDCLDVLLMSVGTGAGGPPSRPDLADHPRARHAGLIRADVVVYGDRRGLITLGAGVGRLPEIGVELADATGTGVGRSLIRDALGLIGAGDPVVASVAPGNARALRAFLRAGFEPVGSVQVVRPGGA
jgi:ribosomal protein S18 acetylase RimI-like enzyme